MKRSPTAPEVQDSAVHARGRHDWNEQVGTVATDRDFWRWTALGSIGVAGCAVLGLAYIGSLSHFVPIVVPIDKIGEPIATLRGDVATPLDARVIKQQLGNWIVNIRTVNTDVKMQRGLIDTAYALVRRTSPTFRALNEWFAANSPFERAKTETVSVNINSVLPLSESTWQIQWCEDHRSRDGSPAPSEAWRAVLNTSITPQTTEAAIRKNPTGIFVDNHQWQQLPLKGACS